MSFLLMARGAGGYTPAEEPEPDPSITFDISNTDDWQVVEGAESIGRTLTIQRFGGYTGDVTIAADGLPEGVTLLVTTNPLTGGTLQTQARLSAEEGAVGEADAFTITASGDGIDDVVLNLTVTVLAPEAFDGFAELPRVTPSFDKLAFVSYSGGDLHEPANAAELDTLLTGGTLNGKTWKRGDRMVLAAEVNYNSDGSQRTFPELAGTFDAADPATWMHVFTSARASLPALGVRVADGDKSLMPLFRQQSSGGAPPFVVANGARGYFFHGIAADGGSVTSTSRIMQLGAPTTSNDECPDWIVLLQCHVSTVRSNNSQRCIRPHTKTCLILDSHVFNTASAGVEDQAIGGWNTIGPMLIENNYLVAGGENIMFGGATRSLPNDTVGPADITIRRNHFFKPYEWNEHHPSWDGVNIVCKNLYEIKHGTRILFEDNVCENFWLPDQVYAVNLKFDTFTGQAHEESTDLIVRYNKFIHIGAFLTASGHARHRRITVRHNYAVQLTVATAGASSSTPLTALATHGITFKNNTLVAEQVGNLMIACDNSELAETVIIEDNIMHRMANGVKRSATVAGTPSMDASWSDYSFTGNAVITGFGGATYPSGNQTPADIAACGFENAGTYDYRLRSDSALKGTGKNGGDPGADIVTVDARTAGCISGDWS